MFSEDKKACPCLTKVDFNVSLCLQIVGPSTLLSFALLAIPLGRGGTMNEVGFICNQIVYCLFGFILMRYNFEIAVPGLNAGTFFCAVGTATALLIVLYWLFFEGVINGLLDGVLRTIPGLLYSFSLVAGYLVHALSVDPAALSSGDSSDKVQVTMSPMRHKLSIISAGSSTGSAGLQDSFLVHGDHGSSTPQASVPGYWPCIKEDWFGLSPYIADMKGVTVLGSPVKQWCRALAAWLGVSSTYVLCQYLASEFQRATGLFGEIGVYLIFSLSFSVIRPVVRYLGHLIDTNKSGGASMEVLMEMAISYFFYTFYRNLFISVHSYSLFFMIKGLHVFSEVLNYSICFSAWYQNSLRDWFARYQNDPMRLQLLTVFCGCRSADMLLQTHCFRSGMRLYLFISSVLSFVLFFAFLRFGYNSSFYCLYDEVSGAHYALLMNMTMLSVAIELLIFWYTDVLCSSNYKHGILSTWQSFLSGKLGLSHRTVVLFMIWLMAHVSTDVYLSRLDTSSIGGEKCPDINY